jgi:hypothetical protein
VTVAATTVGRDAATVPSVASQAIFLSVDTVQWAVVKETLYMTPYHRVDLKAASIGGMLALMTMGLGVGCKDSQRPAVAAPNGSSEAATDPGRSDGTIDLDALWPPVRTNPPALLDFGEVPLNVPAEKVIELVNRGDVDVRLRDSRTNCGCTTADVAGLVVPANGTLELPIHFDAEGRIGERSATVDLFFEGWERPIKFRVVAVVVGS